MDGTCTFRLVSLFAERSAPLRSADTANFLMVMHEAVKRGRGHRGGHRDPLAPIKRRPTKKQPQTCGGGGPFLSPEEEEEGNDELEKYCEKSREGK